MFFRYLQFETVSTRRIQVALRHYRRPIKIWCDVHVLLLNQLSKRPREVRQTLGELSSSGRQKQFQTYPNSDSRLPSSAAHPPSTTSSSASAARTQYVRYSSDYVRLRFLSVLLRHRLLRRRRNAPPFPDRHDTLANAIGERLHPRHPLPSIKSSPRLFRFISLADFRSDRPRTDAVRIFRPTWNRSLRPAPLHAATAPNPSKTPTVSLASAKE